MCNRRRRHGAPGVTGSHKNDEQAILKAASFAGERTGAEPRLAVSRRLGFLRPAETTAYFFLGSGFGGAVGFKPAAASCKSLTAVALNSYNAGSFSRFAT